MIDYALIGMVYPSNRPPLTVYLEVERVLQKNRVYLLPECVMMRTIIARLNTRDVLQILRFLIVLFVIGWVCFLVGEIHWGSSSSTLRGASSAAVTIPEPNALKSNLRVDKVNLEELDHLVVVAGHAVVKITELAQADTQDDCWYLLPYQRNQGFPEIIASHILKGIELTNADEKAMLVFSGGESRRDVGPISEAASYYYLAIEKKWMPNIIPRVFLEEYARDSFENLLFSICRFREVVGRYPHHITVIGFDFKEHRFAALHRMALHIPSANFTYVGMVPAPKHASFDHAKAVIGEQGAYESFEKDLYGCNDFSLAHKREARNPFHRTIPYELACPEMKTLFHYCGPKLIEESEIPWNEHFQPPSS
jgi:hypothetical protein